MALLLALPGCFGGDAVDERTAANAASNRDCVPHQTAVPVGRLHPRATGWAFGKPPVYVTFLDEPMYRAARSGPGSFVPIHRGTERNGQYGVKVGTIINPRFAGEIRQEVAAVTPGRKAAFSVGSRSNLEIDRLPATRNLNVTRHDAGIPGGLRFTGPGCYRLTIEAKGERYAVAFPVRYGGAE